MTSVTETPSQHGEPDRAPSAPPRDVELAGAPSGVTPPHPRRTRWRAGVAVVVVLVVGGAGWLVLWSRSPAPVAPATNTTKTPTAKVTRRDLIEKATVDGTLGYGDSTALFGPGGTVTGVVATGTVVERGQAVAEIDGTAVPLLYGTVPLWRVLSGAATDGTDIKMLEENLQALGYADGLSLTVDEHWTDATLVAVRRWQKALGREQNGAVHPGDAVVHDGPARIAKVGAALGQSAPGGAGIVEVTGTQRTVQAKVKASQQSLVHEGDAADVELPDRKTTTGHITKVGTVAAADAKGGSTDATVTIDITIDDLSVAGSLDQAPVSVKITASAAKGVLAVPVGALLALREGGYAVQVSRGGTTSLVSVTTGAFADSWVQVEGELREGDVVVVPA
jgi:hypothetical protein